MQNFTLMLADTKNASECWGLLQELVGLHIGYKLFTVMTVDMDRLEACRAYSSNPVDYPVSGVKPITYDHWFEIVHKQQRLFVANTIQEIAAVFPDHEKIKSLGCGSVANIPVIVADQLVATINVLHVEQHFNDERVEIITTQLMKPSHSAYLRAAQLQLP
jgi:GAF domain-containing protein